MVGGITDWSYTIELQDRGSPHVHMVLWTNKTSRELLQMDNLVVAQIPNATTNPELYDLVTARQIHRCGDYCRKADGNCRFGFPHAPSDRAAYYLSTNRCSYKRSIHDSFVNSYCPYLLQLTRVSMDIQINFSQSVMYYLAKYMSKVDQEVDVEYGRGLPF